MPIPRVLAVALLSMALSARGAPPAQSQSPPRQPAPVRPCLVDSVSCLSMAPQPFRPCLAVPQSCGDHFELTPAGRPAWTPAARPQPR